jgi:signal transduction histidine kinase
VSAALAVCGWLAAVALAVRAAILSRRLELVACAEHELRGPLTAFSLCLEVSRRDPSARRLATALGPATTVVPGHGRPVDREFVQRQAAALCTVADLLREVHAAGAVAADAVAAARGRWPFPENGLQPAVDAAYPALG